MLVLSNVQKVLKLSWLVTTGEFKSVLKGQENSTLGECEIVSDNFTCLCMSLSFVLHSN